MSLWDNITGYFSDFSFGKAADKFEGFLGNVFEPEITTSREYTPYKSSQSFVGGSQKFPPQNRTYMGADRGYQYFDDRGASLRHSSAGRYLDKQTQNFSYTRGSGFRGTPFEYPAAIVGGTFSTLRDVVNDYVIDPLAKFAESRTGQLAKDKLIEAGGSFAETYAQQQLSQRSKPTDRFKLDAGNRGNRISRFTQQGTSGTGAQFVSGKTGISNTLMNVLGSKIQDADVLPNSDMAYLKYFIDKQQSQGVFTGIRDVPGIKTSLSRPPVTTTVSS